jgi:hypothetical protein
VRLVLSIRELHAQGYEPKRLAWMFFLPQSAVDAILKE